MATTEAQKIPNTILSRCQRFDFRRIPARLIADHLKEICEQEKVKFEPEALWVVARQGDGSMRDSQSLLEQVISFTEGQLTVAKVTEVLGLTDRLMLIDTLKALIARDTTALVGVIEKLFASGYDPVVFTQDLLEELRNLLLIKVVAKGVSSAIDLSDEEIDHLQKISADLGEEDIHLLFDMALKGAQDLLRSQDARVILEMLLLRMSAAPRLRDLRQITMGGSAAHASSKKAAPRQTTGAAMAAPAQASSELSGDAQTWVDLVERVKAVNPLIGAKLEHLQMVSVSADLVKVSIPEKYKFLAGQIDDPQVVKKLKNYMKTFWGKAPEVEFVHTSGADSTAVSAKEIAENKQKNKKEQIQHQVENHPLVRSMKDLFNTEITSIKEKP
jgi:DNA polymerase-3 subunit gamma/tau